MLVEDPRRTILTICNFKNKLIDWHQFKIAYESMINKKASRGTVDTHFYSLRQLGFLNEVEPSKYTLSKEGIMICDYLSSNNEDLYKQGLRGLILNSEKKDIFDKFLKYIDNKIVVSQEELTEIFNSITVRAIISWTKEADLIEYIKEEKKIWKIRQEYKKYDDINIFWNDLKEIYNKLQKSEIFNVDKLFLSISELRNNFCMIKGCKSEEFDKNLIELLNSDYKQLIRLYGGPPTVFENKTNFYFKDMKYAYIRLKV